MLRPPPLSTQPVSDVSVLPDIFNVVIQAGAILAVVFIYWHKIIGLVSNLDQPESRNYLLKVFLAFIVTTGLYLGVSHLIGHHKLAGLAQQGIGAAGMGIIAEKPEKFGQVLFFFVIPETLWIIGFVLGIILLLNIL